MDINKFFIDLFDNSYSYIYNLCKKNKNVANKYRVLYLENIKQLIDITVDIVNININDANTLYKNANDMLQIIFKGISDSLEHHRDIQLNTSKYIDSMSRILMKYKFGCINNLRPKGYISNPYNVIPFIILDLVSISKYMRINGCKLKWPYSSISYNGQCYINIYNQYFKNIEITDVSVIESHKENKVTNIMIYTIMGVVALIFIIMFIFVRYKKVI
jgi:hypothetical protein